MMDKKDMEILNLRKRVVAQREEIKRLSAENAALRSAVSGRPQTEKEEVK